MVFCIEGNPVASGGPEDRLLSWEKVKDITGLSRSTAWRMTRAGAFPSRVSISPGRVGWWESELTAWKGARGSARAIDPPLRAPRERPLEPPMTPRFPGMSRPAPLRKATPARTVGAQPELPMNPPAVSPSARRRRRGGQSVDQIDFGF